MSDTGTWLMIRASQYRTNVCVHLTNDSQQYICSGCRGEAKHKCVTILDVRCTQLSNHKLGMLELSEPVCDIVSNTYMSTKIRVVCSNDTITTTQEQFLNHGSQIKYLKNCLILYLIFVRIFITTSCQY